MSNKIADISYEDDPTKGRYVARIDGVKGEGELTTSKVTDHLIIADGSVDGVDVLSSSDGFNKHHIGTLRCHQEGVSTPSTESRQEELRRLLINARTKKTSEALLHRGQSASVVSTAEHQK